MYIGESAHQTTYDVLPREALGSAQCVCTNVTLMVGCPAQGVGMIPNIIMGWWKVKNARSGLDLHKLPLEVGQPD